MRFAFLAALAAIPSVALADAPYGGLASDFFRADAARWQRQEPAQRSPYGRLSPSRAAVRQMVHIEATRRLGPRWAAVAVRLARIESGFRCGALGPRTRHGRAIGVFQVLPSAARRLGYSASGLKDCRHGIRVGLAHMADCIAKGAQTAALVARCHLGGPGSIGRRQNASAERYHQKYQAMFAGRKIASRKRITSKRVARKTRLAAYVNGRRWR